MKTIKLFSSSARHRFLLLMLLTMFTCGNVWGDYLEITYTSLGISGTTYTSSSKTFTDVATINWTTANVNSSKLRLKASGELWNSTAMPYNIDSIVMTGVSYSSSNNSGFYMYGGTSAKATTTELYDNNGTGKIKIDFTSYSYKYFYIKNKSSRTLDETSIRVYYTAGSGSNPSLTANPTSLSWGTTVLQGSTPGTKTVSISGSNLTSGNLTISASNGYSVSPTSVAVNGTLSATTLTITPPSTSTTGAKNGTLTISGGGLSSSVTVSLSMTVVAAYAVNWFVEGQAYTTGNPTRLVASGGTIETFPTPPNSCDDSKVFVGWSETNIGSTETNTAPTLITTATTISATKNYYAVFAKRGDFTRITGPSSLTANMQLVIVSNKYSTAITNANTPSYATAPTESSSKITPTDAMIWLLTGSSSGWKISAPNGKLLGYASNPNSNASTTATLAANNTLSTWKIGQNSYTSDVLYISNYTTNTCALEAGSATSAWVVYNSSSYSSNQYCALKVYGSSFTKYVTQCCNKLGSINGSITLTYSGTSATVKGWTYTQGSGAAESHISTYDVYLYSDADNYAAPISTQTCAYNAKGTGVTFTELSYARTYKVKIGATGASTYCDITPVQVTTINSTSTETFQLPCVSAGLAYGTASVTKTFGDAAFTNSLTNSHNVTVSYAASSVSPAGCISVNSTTGAVTINGAGSATITATAAEQIVSNVRYCEGSASYTLTVNKADISPTLSYTSTNLTTGYNSSSPTITGNTGSGAVTYSVTAADPSGCVTVDPSTGVVTANAAGTATVTATIAATDNYNGGTATANFTITNAVCSDFSFHTGGTDVKTNNTPTCFTQVNSSTTWKIENYTIPNNSTDSRFFVGHHGYFYDDNLGSANSRSVVAKWADEMFFEYTKNYGDGYRPTVGWAKGAVGTLYIWSDNNWNNLHVGFSPQGYVFKLGSTNLAMTGSSTLDAARYWETEVRTLTAANISGNYQVNLYKADAAGGVASNNTQSTALNTMGVKSNSGDNWRATPIGESDANTRGFFRIDIGDGGTKNWHAHFVPTHRVIFHSNYPSGNGPADTYSVDVSIEQTNNSIALDPAPTAPTGYTWDGWYTAASGGTKVTTARSIAAGATADIELWGHWTANTITLTLDKNNSDASGSSNGSASILYDATAVKASPAMVAASRTGYTVEGYYTDPACTASKKVLDASGNVINSTVSGFTTSGKWTRATTPTTLYAKWNVVNYTVTWYAGGTAAGNITTAGSPNTSVAYGSKVTTLPTNPDGSACDKVFVGWTNTTSYTHGTSLLFTDAAGSPAITGNTSFYAVFATGGIITEELTSSELTTNITNTACVYDTQKTYTDGDISYAFNVYTDAASRPWVQLKAASPSAIKIEAPQNISNVELTITSATNSSGGINDISKHTALANTTTISLRSTSRTGTVVASNTGENVSSNVLIIPVSSPANSTLYLTTSAGCRIWNIKVTYSSYSNYTITCSDCGTSITPTFTAAPTGGTVAVTKGGNAVTSGSTVKTCSAVELSVTITPASHYSLTGFTATGLTTGTATISPAVASTLPVTSAQTFTVTVSASATGTLNLTPTLVEDAHKAISWVVHGGSATIADGHGTTWVYSGEDLTGIPEAPDAPAGCSGKTFVGWSENDGGATEEDASYYNDLFTTLGGAPTGITTDKTFTAVFATPAAGLGGTVMWAEDFSGYSANNVPSGATANSHTGTTVYNNGSVTYACTNGGSDTKIYNEALAGGTSPEILVGKNTGVFAVTNIPTGGQTELTLTYKCNKGTTNFTVTTGTSGVTIGDADVDGTTYTRTITINQSPAVNNFALSFNMTANSNARLDDISLIVPGSSSATGYVTTCEDTYIITYNKNTEDPVTNLPSPTGISQATGSGTLSSKVPTRYAYTFTGWATTPNGAVAYAAGAAISSVSADMTLYAVWQLTAVTEINLSKSSLDKYVGDPSVTLSVTSVLPDGASTSVNWSSSNTTIATVSASGEVNFLAVGTATITATSTVTNTTTATCTVTVWEKPTATFLDNMHGLTVDANNVTLSSYDLQAAAGTAVVFPTLANQIAGSGTCEDEHYVFVGWTTSDNNDDPEDHLVTSHTLSNGDAITYYAVWADGVAGTTYTRLENASFSTSKHYVLGAVHPDNGTTYYFNSCTKTDKENSWGYVTSSPATETPIEFTLSGTKAALVVTSTESTARYLEPTTTNNFQMSATSKTIQLHDDGKLYSTDDTRRLLLNKSQPGLRWYGTGTISGTSNAYFYEVTAGGEVSYRTSCCANKVPAPTVTATKTSTSITLNWNDLSASGATGYEVSWNGGAFGSPSGTRTHTVSGLTPNTTYTWKVRATYTTPKCGADIASGSTTTNQVYHVTYAKGDGEANCSATGSTTDATAYEAGATVTLQANGFTLVGHIFDAWTNDDADVTISNNQFTMPDHDVVITASWTAKMDKYFDRMHDQTDALHGGVVETEGVNEGKYYIAKTGCNYAIPTAVDSKTGDACQTSHYKLQGWIAASYVASDGTITAANLSAHLFPPSGTKTATGATYYAVWAEVTE